MEKGDFPHDPNDHSGEPLHMHGENGEKNAEDDASRAKNERSKSVAQEGGDPHGEEKKGTGEQYVKSSGLAADGGDFDASNPGAGAEANRLLEEKGIHKSEDNKGEPQDLGTGSESHDSTAKVSKLDKIKEKLHLKH